MKHPSDILKEEKRKIDKDPTRSPFEKERDKARLDELYNLDTQRVGGNEGESYDDFDEYQDEKERWDKEH